MERSSNIRLCISWKIIRYKTNRTTPYRFQGNSVSERVPSTIHGMLANGMLVMHS